MQPSGEVGRGIQETTPMASSIARNPISINSGFRSRAKKTKKAIQTSHINHRCVYKVSSLYDRNDFLVTKLVHGFESEPKHLYPMAEPMDVDSEATRGTKRKADELSAAVTAPRRIKASLVLFFHRSHSKII